MTFAPTCDMVKDSVQTLRLPVGSRFARWLEASLRFTRRRPLGAVGAAIIGVMIAAALLAGIVSPYDPLTTDYGKMLQAPNSFHWFGTDTFGRDVFTRIIYGSPHASLRRGVGLVPGVSCRRRTPRRYCY